MSESEKIVFLIDKCLKGAATDKEFSELESWISSSYENRKFYFQIKNIKEIAGIKIKPADIQVNEALLEVQRKVSPGKKYKTVPGIIQKIAAILLIPLLVGSFFIGRSVNVKKTNDLQLPVFNEVIAAHGTRSLLILSDGSKVWLNAGSKLKYPDKFAADDRVVYLWGEAYFEVESEPAKPFVVKTANIDVIATGTKFNVNTTNLVNFFEVTLIQGKVTVNRTPPGEKSLKISEMLPNQHLVYDSISGKIDVLFVDTYKYIAWKDGKLAFRNDPFNEAIQRISYFYNVDIELRGEKLKEYSLRATFEEETLSEFLKLLKLSSPVDYIEVQRKMLPDGTFTKKKIIIFPVNEEI